MFNPILGTNWCSRKPSVALWSGFTLQDEVDLNAGYMNASMTSLKAGQVHSKGFMELCFGEGAKNTQSS